MSSKDVGVLGEKIAAQYLTSKQYTILEKNYRPSFISGPQIGEIDIIARKGDSIYFIEVKTIVQTHGSQQYYPENKVDFVKQKKIMKTAELWLMQKKILLDNPWQVDVIAVEIDQRAKTARIRHLENIG